MSALDSHSFPVSLRIIVALFLLLSCREEAPVQSVDQPVALTIDQRVDSVLALMTLTEKIGQMTQAERGALASDRDIIEYHLGSLLSGGGSGPADNSPQGWADMYDRYQLAALQSRLKIPLIYGIDAVHGHNNVRGAVINPHNIGLGCTNDPAVVEAVERMTAEEVAGTGIDWTFAPCIAVPRDERWGRTYEGFSESPALTRAMAAAAVRGFQGDALDGQASIVACAKHFLGDGGTTGGQDQGNTEVDELEMRSTHLQGYLGALESGVGSIMVSFSSWNGQKMHGSRYWLTDVLKNELGFGGFIVTDWNGIDQLPGDMSSDIEQGINAGIDMVMVPNAFREFIATLHTLVNSGRVPLARIDDAVRRILRKKFELGLFERPFADRSLTIQIGSQAHRETARDAVRKSVVLLKNEGQTLPLNPSISHLLVAGKNADDIGNQCGGWTITWQGSSGAITQGTTILQAVRNAVSPGTTVSYSRDGSGVAGAQVGIVVVGETPYAEGAGDRSNLELSSEDVSAIVRVKSLNIPTVVVLVSGRPMIVETVVGISDAFVAAWLPGTEGDGVADVLFGNYSPTGKLSFTWPRTMSQIPINVGDALYNPLFPFGFGMTYE